MCHACRHAHVQTGRLYLCPRYLGLIWLLVEASLNGIKFWGPLLVRSILDGNGAAPGKLHCCIIPASTRCS